MQKDLLMTEMEYKINNLTSEHQSVMVENQQLKDEINRIQEAYAQKIMQQEEKLSQCYGEMQSQQIKFQHEVERLKAEAD